MNIQTLIVNVAILCIAAGVIYYLITTFMPAPAQKFAMAVFIVVMALIAIAMLSGGSGPFVTLR